VPPLTLQIAPRYNGPPSSGNGGYVAGRLARAVLEDAGLPTLDGPPVEVTLRSPPPLGTPLTLTRSDASPPAAQVDAGGVLVAQVRVLDESSSPAVTLPGLAPVDLATAREATSRYPGLQEHPFPTCWVCGTGRPPGDGYHLQPGMLDDTTAACVWHVRADQVASQPGSGPAVEAVWAALDCPGGWTTLAQQRIVVLGRVTAVVRGVPEPGEDCVVTGQRFETEGRKTITGTRVVGADGRLLGLARSVWVEPA
jgi:hypothetical protein